MKKRLAVLAISLMLVLTGCGGTITTTTSIYENGEKDFWNKFVVIESYKNIDDGGTLYLIYDKDTKVKYYMINSTYKFNICPIYNADGTIQVYEGE